MTHLKIKMLQYANSHAAAIVCEGDKAYRALTTTSIHGLTKTNTIVKWARQWLFFRHKLWRLNMDSSTLCNFHRCTTESILTGYITAWHGSCNALNSKALQRVMRTIQHIVRVKLPSMEDLYTQRCREKANRIIKDPNHCSQKFSGRQHHCICSRTTRLMDSFIPQAIKLFNLYSILLYYLCYPAFISV